MTITEMTEVVKNALNEYRKAKTTTIIERAVNEMENVYIMVCCYSIPGSDTLRKAILEARGI